MASIEPNNTIIKTQYTLLLLIGLIAAGLAGNYFHFSIINAHFIFGSRTDFAAIDRNIRTTLIQASQHMSDSLKNWLEDRRQPVVYLATAAQTLSPEQMQTRIEQTRASDANFLRITLLNKESITVAYSPLVDELGQSTIGKNFSDRPYIPLLMLSHQPMLS